MFPKYFKPQLATLTNQTPLETEWIHETKFDGYRILCFIKPNSIQLITRNGKSWGSKFPKLVQQLKTFPFLNTILDGELVVLNKKGISEFQLLQNALKGDPKTSFTYFIFDIPYLEGKNLSSIPLLIRKQKLKTVFKAWKSSHRNVMQTQYIQGLGKKVFRAACRQGLEGIISKNTKSYYEQKRTKTWLKSKCIQHQEFVIGGFTKPQKSRKYFGALLLGYYNKNKSFVYCGKVGTGFSEEMLKELYQRLKPLIRKKSPFNPNNKIEKLNETTWVKPILVAELSFTEWTQDGRLRHPSFLGLRLDKSPKDVTRVG